MCCRDEEPFKWVYVSADDRQQPRLGQIGGSERWWETAVTTVVC